MLQKSERKWPWCNLWYYSGICTEVEDNHTKTQDGWSPGQDLNTVPPKHEAEELLRPECIKYQT
jgi:hypothetical protein